MHWVRSCCIACDVNILDPKTYTFLEYDEKRSCNGAARIDGRGMGLENFKSQ